MGHREPNSSQFPKTLNTAIVNIDKRSDRVKRLTACANNTTDTSTSQTIENELDRGKATAHIPNHRNVPVLQLPLQRALRRLLPIVRLDRVCRGRLPHLLLTLIRTIGCVFDGARHGCRQAVRLSAFTRGREGERRSKEATDDASLVILQKLMRGHAARVEKAAYDAVRSEDPSAPKTVWWLPRKNSKQSPHAVNSILAKYPSACKWSYVAGELPGSVDDTRRRAITDPSMYHTARVTSI